MFDDNLKTKIFNEISQINNSQNSNNYLPKKQSKTVVSIADYELNALIMMNYSQMKTIQEN